MLGRREESGNLNVQGIEYVDGQEVRVAGCLVTGLGEGVEERVVVEPEVAAE